MGRRHLAALACAALLGALAASTDSSAAPAAGTLTVVIEGAFRGCDPGAPGTSPAVDAVLSLVLPSAFTSRPDGSPASDAEVFAQAEPVVPSPLTVLYTIAPGATWSNGRPLTAQDLIRTWQQRRGGGTVGDLGYRQIASITPSASGQSATVVFRDAYADWQSLFDEMVPPATFGARCELPSGTLDPSLGPYEVASASSTQVVLRENPSWTGSAPAFPDVVVTNQLAAPAAFAAPRIVYAPAPSLGTLQALTSSGSLNSRMFASSSVVSLDFATRGPFALSLLARRGVADFVDRQAIVDAVAAPVDDTAAPEASHLFGQGDGDYSGPFGSPVSHPIPLPPPVPGALGPLAYGPGAQVAAGESDLVAAGYARGPAGWDLAGRTAALCLAVPAGEPGLGQDGALLAAQLESRGFQVDLETLPSETAVAAALRQGSCTAGVLLRSGGWYVSQVAASWLDPPASTTGVLTEGLNDPVVTTDALLAGTTLDPVDAASTWDLLDDRLWQLMVGLPLYSPSAYVGWSTSVAGVQECNSLSAFIDQIPTTIVPASSRP